MIVGVVIFLIVGVVLFYPNLVEMFDGEEVLPEDSETDSATVGVEIASTTTPSVSVVTGNVVNWDKYNYDYADKPE